MQIVYPADMLQPKQPDAAFAEEIAAMRAHGHSIAVIDVALQTIRPKLEPNTHVLYRGWMLTPEEYRAFITAVEAQGATPLTSVEQYLNAHYLPHWYPILAEWTPKTVICKVDDEPVQILKKLNWSAYFIKDYVKSIKTGHGSIITNPEAVEQVITDMQTYRGTIEGGLCIREVEEFIPNTEQRFFVINGRAYGVTEDTIIPEAVVYAAQHIASPYFSIDIVQRRDGIQRIVEIGDGQVSDLVGWTTQRFADIWKRGKDLFGTSTT